MIDNILFECPGCKGWHFNMTRAGTLQCTSVMKPPKFGCGWSGILPHYQKIEKAHEKEIFNLTVDLSNARSLIRQAHKVKVVVTQENYKEITAIFMHYADTIKAATEEGAQPDG